MGQSLHSLGHRQSELRMICVPHNAKSRPLPLAFRRMIDLHGRR